MKKRRNHFFWSWWSPAVHRWAPSELRGLCSPSHCFAGRQFSQGSNFPFGLQSPSPSFGLLPQRPDFPSGRGDVTALQGEISTTERGPFWGFYTSVASWKCIHTSSLFCFCSLSWVGSFEHDPVLGQICLSSHISFEVHSYSKWDQSYKE